MAARPLTAEDSPSTSVRRQLVDEIMDFYADPYGFVLYIFPWGTGALAPTAIDPEPGPDVWQRDVLVRLGNQIKAGFPADKAIRMAVASGHGVGKTGLVAWIILWFISTRPNPQIVVTANTKNQLADKTWRELGKWKNLAINGDWFEWTATKLRHKGDPNLWFASAVPWSASNPQAFAGTHEANVLIIMDEASEIVDDIWETTEGAMTTPGAIWLAFGNPTSNTTRFRRCWTKFRKRWVTWRVDSRNAKMADNHQIKQWIEDYGIDSDFVRVRVLGLFPKTGPKQLIGNRVIEEAIERKIDEMTIPAGLPKLMGVDVGSYGNAQTVITLRKGPLLKDSIIKFRESSPHRTANMIGKYINDWKPDNVYIDASGHGHGVYLLLVQMGHDNVVAVWNGSQKSVSEPKMYYNVRIETWYRMKVWLETADIPDDKELYEDLIGPEYNYDLRNRMRLERKEEMAKRGLPSPDCFVAGTLVDTPSGQRQIETITVGALVNTPMGPQRVVGRQESETPALTTVEFSNGAVLTGKGGHKIFTWNAGWVRLDTLSLANECESNHILSRFLWAIQRKLFTKGSPSGFKHQVDIIHRATKLRRSAFFTGVFGPSSMERYQRGIACIIKTMIGQTIELETLSACPSANMRQSTFVSDGRIQSIESGQRLIWPRSEKRQPSGTLLLRGESGTEKTPRNGGSEKNHTPQLAPFAGRGMKPISLHAVDSVGEVANRRKRIRGIKQLLASALIAISRSLLTNIGIKSVVLVRVQTVSEDRPVKVYNLTLDHENVYYANGILVANCADSLALTFCQALPMTRLDASTEYTEPEVV